MNLNYERMFEQIYNETHFFESKKLTTEEFIARAKILHPEYDYSKVNYVNYNTKVLIGCPKHGYFSKSPNEFLFQKQGCPSCGKESGIQKRRKTTEEFIEKAKLFHPEYDYSKVDYVNNKTKVLIGCPKHGDFLITPDGLLSGYGCRKCGVELSHRNCRKTTEEFIEKAKLFHPEYDYSKVNYVNRRTPVLIGCPKHGYFSTTPDILLGGHGCKKCGIDLNRERCRKTTEDFVTKAKLLHPEYDYSKVNYVNSKTKVLIGCPKHGYVHVNPHNFLNGSGCPICSESKGEIEIREWLENHNITYKRQHRFADLKKYPYDFYVPDFNLIIEYNGIQHYEEKPFFHRRPDSFNGQLMRDTIKKDYAEKNGYDFLIIPYWQYKEIDKILSEKLLSS